MGTSPVSSHLRTRASKRIGTTCRSQWLPMASKNSRGLRPRLRRYASAPVARACSPSVAGRNPWSRPCW
eukprot:9962132-Lingulodinium_polyedra.AAC.1